MRELAEALEAEAACVWGGWAGALVVAAAACVAGEDRRAIQGLPDAGGRPNRIALQRGHVLAIGGGSIPQLLRLGGAAPVEAGASDRCEPEDLDAALADAAAGLFVASAASPAGLIALAPFVWRCRQAGRPALVAILDGLPPAAALDAGAALVILDGSALGGPPCGIVAGSLPLVRACAAQDRGVGRALRARPDDAALLLAAAPRAR